MDQRRKNAYRYLLYWAVLDIRPIAWLRMSNPLHWRRELRRVRLAGAVADWLHNLALFSALEFDRFDEEWFWRDGQSLKKRSLEFDLDRYQQIFDRHLSESADQIQS